MSHTLWQIWLIGAFQGMALGAVLGYLVGSGML